MRKTRFTILPVRGITEISVTRNMCCAIITRKNPECCLYYAKNLKKILFDIFFKKYLTFPDLYSRINLVLERQNNRICDSGVVGNARPCQGRDRGFEPRLSLSKRLSIIGKSFCFYTHSKIRFISFATPFSSLLSIIFSASFRTAGTAFFTAQE